MTDDGRSGVAMSAEGRAQAERLRALRELQRKRTQLPGIQVGSVGGVRISLDYSWFIIFFLILGTFTGVAFPRTIPGYGQTAYLVMGAVGTFLFFASLLAHELAHSFVAQWKGIEVEGITLFIFGGMARTRSEAGSPGDEFQIAGVGPLASLILAVAFYGVAVAGSAQGWSDAVVGVSQHLGFLNLALAVFNLFPGFPLDGGRLLRAVVWRLTGSLQKATKVATTAGRWLGYMIIAAGLYFLLIMNQLVGGLWFIFIGWFLSNAANASYQHLLLRHVLQDIRARDAMTPFPETVTPDVPVDVLVDRYFLRRPYNAFPVTEDGIVVGMVTLSQVKQVDQSRWPNIRVADVMTPLVETLVVEPDAPMTDVLERMGENETRRVIVADEWELRGIISGGDVANWLDRAGLVR